MKTTAAVLFEANRPLELLELSVPDLAPGQVFVEVAHSGICHSQLMEIQGKRGEDHWLPHLLGHEGAGVVLGIGDGVTKVKVGDHVVLTWIKGEGMNVAGATYTLGDLTVNSGAVTTFSTHTVVSENRCVKIADDVPLDVATLFGCALPTGAGMVLNTIEPGGDHTMSIWGMGGIGMSALLGASVAECRLIIAVDIDDATLSLASELGATHTVNASKEDPLEAIREIVQADGVDFAVEAAGKTETIEQAFDSVRRGGGVCVFASHPDHGSRIRLDPFELICGKRIMGSWGGETKPDRDFPRFAAHYRDGRIPLEKLIAARFDLADINDAVHCLENGVPGRIILDMR